MHSDGVFLLLFMFKYPSYFFPFFNFQAQNGHPFFRMPPFTLFTACLVCPYLECLFAWCSSLMVFMLAYI